MVLFNDPVVLHASYRRFKSGGERTEASCFISQLSWKSSHSGEVGRLLQDDATHRPVIRLVFKLSDYFRQRDQPRLQPLIALRVVLS